MVIAAAAATANAPPAVESVVVTAQKPQVQTLVDRKVYTVGADLLATTGSAADILNTLPSVEVDADGAFVQEAALPAPGALAHGSPGTAYVLLRALDAGEDAPLPTASLPATLRFKVKEIDPASGEVRAGRASVGGWAVRPKRCSSTPHAPRPCQSVSPRFPTPSRSTRPSPLLPPPPHHPLHPSGRGGGIRR